jgi:hypothetical protein
VLEFMDRSHPALLIANAETATLTLNIRFLQAQSAPLRTGVKEIVTLLAKSCRAISKAMGVRGTTGGGGIFLAFTRSREDGDAARV